MPHRLLSKTGPASCRRSAASLQLLLLAALATPLVAAQQFPNFTNPGGPPFVEGPVYQLDAETLSSVLMNGVVANGSYTLTAGGSGTSYRLTGMCSTGTSGLACLSGSRWLSSPSPAARRPLPVLAVRAGARIVPSGGGGSDHLPKWHM